LSKRERGIRPGIESSTVLRSLRVRAASLRPISANLKFLVRELKVNSFYLLDLFYDHSQDSRTVPLPPQ
jgi:hypothetical protein